MDQLFTIFSITEEIVRDILKNPPSPHRHDHEELLIITRGAPVHYIDFIEEKSSAPYVIYIAQGKIHEFIPDLKTRGWCIRYKNEFTGDSNFNFYSHYLDKISFAYNEGDCRQKIGILCELILFEYQYHPANQDVYRHLFQALLAKLEAEGQHHLPVQAEARTPRQIAFRNFLRILESNYKRPVGVGFYADKLNTSVRNLNHLCSNLFGKSVSEIIETRKLIEARRLLLNSSMSVSEIGFELGYNEKSYFTRVFRKKTGLTPTDFRAAVQPMTS
jgi:AraC-like DNA-binding protein